MVFPVVLAVIFLFIIFVFPKVTLGLDFVGGTRLVIDVGLLDGQSIKNVLSSELGLSDVKVSVVSSPFGTSTRIEYAEPKRLSDARQLFDQAVLEKNKNPDKAKDLLVQSLSILNKEESFGDVDSLLQETASVLNSETEKLADRVLSVLVSMFGLSPDASFTTERVTPSFGSSFLGNALQVAVVSIILLSLVIFISFREFIPSIAIIEAALFDILTAVALAALFGFSLTLSSVAALLMIIGYSVDTDILLTTRLLKRRDKTVYERANETLKTGFTVTASLIGAAGAMLLVSWMAQITTIFEISAIVLFGMLGDLASTWFTNAPVLLWYWEKKHGKVDS